MSVMSSFLSRFTVLAWVGEQATVRFDRWTAWITADTAVSGDRLVAVMAAFCLLIAPLTYTQAFSDGAISLMAILFLWWSYQRQDFAWARQAWFCAAMVFWAYITLRTLNTTTHTALTAGSGLVWVRFPIAVAAIMMLIAAIPRLPALLLWGYGLTTSFTIVDALFQRVVGHDFFGWQAGGSRLTSPTGKLNVGSILGQIGMPLAAWALTVLVNRQRSLPQRIVAGAAIALLSLTILLSGERMAFLLYMLGMAFALPLIGGFRWRTTVLALGGVAVAVVTVMLAYAPLRDRLADTQGQIAQGFNTTYIQTPLTGVRVFMDQPLFGAGFKQYRYVCMDHQPPTIDPSSCNLHPHNFWVESLAENGLVGSLPFFTLLGLLVVPVVRGWRRWRAEPLLGGAAIAALVHVWPLATSGSFFVNQREVIFWPLIGLALAMTLRQPQGGPQGGPQEG